MSRVALVTGANRGIGLASVRVLMKKFNGIVYLTSRNTERGKDAVRSLNAEGLHPEFRTLDTGNATSVEDLRDYMVDRYGGVDICIHNAGILFPKDDPTPYAKRARATMKTNYFDTVKVCKTFLPIMKSGGRFVTLSTALSLIALQGCQEDVQTFFKSPNLTQDDLTAKLKEFVDIAQTGNPKEYGFDDHAYAMSKLGVNAFTRLMAKHVNDYGQRNILINCCCPGWVRTSMGGENAAFSPDQGAQPPVMLAMLPDGSSEPNGEFHRRRKLVRCYTQNIRYISIQTTVECARMSKVALVTGANRGIGLASVRILLKKFEGIVYLTSRNKERGEEAVQLLNAEGLRPEFQVLDTGDNASIVNLRDFMVKRFGGVDIFIHNAGIMFPKDDPTPYAERVRSTVKTNFFGTVGVFKTFLPIVKSGGRFVTLSSGLSLIALQGCQQDVQTFFKSIELSEDKLSMKMKEFVDNAQTGSHKKCGFDDHAYGMSKLGVNTFTRLMAKRVNDYGQKGILVNCCCPGWVRTSMGGENATFSPDQGAEIPVMLALLPQGVSEPNGEFYRRRKLIPWYQ